MNYNYNIDQIDIENIPESDVIEPQEEKLTASAAIFNHMQTMHMANPNFIDENL